LCEQSHKLVDGNERIDSFECQTCNSHFSTLIFLAEHEALGHPMVEKWKSSYTFSCSSCDMKFRLQKEVTEHQEKCELRNFKCYWCSEEFSEEDFRFKHITENHSEDKSVSVEL